MHIVINLQGEAVAIAPTRDLADQTVSEILASRPDERLSVFYLPDVQVREYLNLTGVKR